jgi:hypothetical protein
VHRAASWRIIGLGIMRPAPRAGSRGQRPTLDVLTPSPVIATSPKKDTITDACASEIAGTIGPVRLRIEQL